MATTTRTSVPRSSGSFRDAACDAGRIAHEQAYTLAQRLAALMLGDLERASSTGSVAVEVAMKMAVQYWSIRAHAQDTRRVPGGYHGDTTGAMAVCDLRPACTRFPRLPARACHRTRPSTTSETALSRLLEERASEIAAIIVEPLVQGAGGMRFHDAEVLRRLRAMADRYELLLIFDEVFTGFARTGTLFACAAAGVGACRS
jgi:adenosylmethionine-8-amino-7-oxononanoate aminotransferase